MPSQVKAKRRKGNKSINTIAVCTIPKIIPDSIRFI